MLHQLVYDKAYHMINHDIKKFHTSINNRLLRVSLFYLPIANPRCILPICPFSLRPAPLRFLTPRTPMATPSTYWSEAPTLSRLRVRMSLTSRKGALAGERGVSDSSIYGSLFLLFSPYSIFSFAPPLFVSLPLLVFFFSSFPFRFHLSFSHFFLSASVF